MEKFKDVSVDSVLQYHFINDVEQLCNKISLRAHSVMLDVCGTLEQFRWKQGEIIM